MADNPSKKSGNGKRSTNRSSSEQSIRSLSNPGPDESSRFLVRVVTPEFENRSDEWDERISIDLNDLAKEGSVNLNDLAKDKVFISTVTQATQAALRTHQQEKLDALRNAVLNAAMATRPDEILQDLFVKMIDQLTILHIRLLSLLLNPQDWFLKHRGQLPNLSMNQDILQLVFEAFPELQRQKDFVEVVLDDLQRVGLLKKFNVGMVRIGNNLEPRGSDLGREFLKFISDPKAI